MVGGVAACYVLVPQNSGLSLDEVEAILMRTSQLYGAIARALRSDRQ
jgi:hypothetical protein